MNPSTLRNLQQRTAASIVLLAGLGLTLFAASYPLLEPLYVAVVAGVIGFALREFYQMARRLGADPLTNAAIFTSTVYVFAVYFGYRGEMKTGETLPHMVLAVGFIAIFCRYFFHGQSPLISVSVTIFGLVWVTLTIACLVRIMFLFPPEQVDQGRWWFFFLLAVTKVTDIGAFFTGKQFGQRKLAVKISPQKTVEGAAGGLLLAIFTSVGFYMLGSSEWKIAPIDLTLMEALGLGIVLGTVGQIGDLAESMIKRSAKVKDSSEIPGLGGVLDVMDSLIFTAPVLTMFLIIR